MSPSSNSGIALSPAHSADFLFNGASSDASGFAYRPDFFEHLVDSALQCAKKLGATDASAHASEGCGMSVSVRCGELENVLRNRDKSLGITVFVGQRSGHAGTSDFSPDAIMQTVRAAYDIARFTAEDPFAALPDQADIATEIRTDLDVFCPWPIACDAATQLATVAEDAAFKVDPQITNSEGAAVSAQQSHFFSAHTHGFRGGFASSHHSVSVSPIAGTGDAMQRDYWYSAKCHATDLDAPELIGQYAAERALRRLNARKIATTLCPVLFEAPLAAGLLGSFVHAVSGGALYRKNSFLLDCLGHSVFPDHIDIDEDPFVKRGRGSTPFDEEGVRVQPRRVVDAGKVQGYFLGSYSARKLGLQTTGNAGGSHNLTLTSRLTHPDDLLPAMLDRLGTGLFVTELMGSGINPVTGDYSRGASGFWIDKGRIAYPVHEITIAGNMRSMLQDIVSVGADTYNQGSKTVGSVLVRQMKVAGS